MIREEKGRKKGPKKKKKKNVPVDRSLQVRLAREWGSPPRGRAL